MTDAERVQEIRERIKTWDICSVTDAGYLLSALDARKRRIEELEQHQHEWHSGEIADRALLGRLVEALEDLLQTQWQHRCVDKIGGCTAVSELSLQDVTEAIADARRALKGDTDVAQTPLCS